MIDRMLRRPEVEEAVGLSRATLYRMIERGDFPRPTKLSERAVGWRQSVVEEWLARLGGLGSGGIGNGM